MCKPKIKKMNGFVKFITFGFAAGITLAPFGIYFNERIWDLDRESDYWKRITNHESIHWKQQMEMLIISFYLWYFLEWLIKLILPPYTSAYKALSFEREAYTNDNNLEYLKSRKHYSWINRVFK